MSTPSSTLGEWHIFGCACLKHKCGVWGDDAGGGGAAGDSFVDMWHIFGIGATIRIRNFSCWRSVACLPAQSDAHLDCIITEYIL